MGYRTVRRAAQTDKPLHSHPSLTAVKSICWTPPSTTPSLSHHLHKPYLMSCPEPRRLKKLVMLLVALGLATLAAFLESPTCMRTTVEVVKALRTFFSGLASMMYTCNQTGNSKTLFLCNHSADPMMGMIRMERRIMVKTRLW